MILFNGNIYLDKEDIEIIKLEPEYVKKRYFAVAKALAGAPFSIVYKNAAKLIDICLRHFYRIVKRFREERIPGLRYKSKRPKNIPNQTPKYIEDQVIAVRDASGFGPNDVAVLMNESYRLNGHKKKFWPSTIYNILVRYGEIEREKLIQSKWKFFEWGHPNRLIQADLTKLNGVNILTMEDDHSRKGWALALRNGKDILYKTH